MPDSATIAFIGLGNMGLPMVSRLTSAGFDVRGYDVSADARSRLSTVGATACDSAVVAVSGAQTVVLMLPNSAIVTAVVDDLLAGDTLAPGTTIVDMSSSEPLATRALAETVRTRGFAFVDAPVSGGVTGARNGRLTIMVGGDAGDIDRVEAILRPLGTVIRCGEVGAGHTVKALNNLLSATHLWATSEAMEAGVAFGLDPEVMLSVFNRSSGRSGSSENKWPNFVLSGGYDSGFGLHLMLKDMKIALGLAESTGVMHEMASRAVSLWQSAADDTDARADHTQIAEWIASHNDRREQSAAPPLRTNVVDQAGSH